MQQNNIKLVPIQENLNGELAETIYYECNLCRKTSKLFPQQRRLCEKLSGKSYYCNFCIQNNLNTKNNRHILITSFRSIIGFYYFSYYLNKKLYFSQIENFIQKHEETGLSYPFMRYDPETYLWFIDFNKIGRGNKKVSIIEVSKAIVNILTCFNIPLVINNFKTSIFYKKYDDALMKFYTSRYRPDNRRLLIPTLVGCGGVPDSKTNEHEFYRNFTKQDFLLKSY